MKKLQFCIWVVIAIFLIALIGGCIYNLVLAKTEKNVHPEVTSELENYGNVKMELYPEYAPNTVTNIIKLIQKGYYNNKVVYGKDEMCLYVGRDADGEYKNPTMSQIADDIKEGSDADFEYSIKGEFVANDFTKNTLRHEKGIVSLIRNNYGSNLAEESYNSGCAQLGVMLTDEAENLNGLYAAFGRVTEGFDILEKIYNESEIAVDENAESSSEGGGIQKFATYPVIKSASVDTHGIDFGMPETQEIFDYNNYMLQMIQNSNQ